jgi:hypothetical protein
VYRTINPVDRNLDASFTAPLIFIKVGGQRAVILLSVQHANDDDGQESLAGRPLETGRA